MSSISLDNALKSKGIFDDVVDLENYSGSFSEGQFLSAGGVQFVVAASGASDHHNTTAGGTKLYVQPVEGIRPVEGFGASTSKTAAQNAAAIQAALDATGTDRVGIGFSDVYEVDSTLTCTGIRGSLVSRTGRSGEANKKGGIKLASGAAGTGLLDVRGQGWTFRGLYLSAGKSPSASGTYVISGEDAEGANNADVDIYVDQCNVCNAETLLVINGRGCYLTDNTFTYMTNVLDLSGYPGTGHVDGSNDDQTLESGFRAYVVKGNRVHAASGGVFVKNTGANKAYLRGLQVSDNYLDTPIRMFSGDCSDSQFSDNVMIGASSPANALFAFTGGAGISISGGTYAGMYDNGDGDTTEYAYFADFTAVTSASISDVTMRRINSDVVRVFSGCGSISWVGGLCEDFCLQNSGATARSPVKVSANLGALTMIGVTLRKTAQTLDNYIIQRSGSTAIDRLVFNGCNYDKMVWTPYHHLFLVTDLSNVSDDGFTSFRPRNPSGFVAIACFSGSSASAMVAFEAFGSNRAMFVGGTPSGWTVTSEAIPTGTTGADGSRNVFIDDGVIYLENRTNETISVTFRDFS